MQPVKINPLTLKILANFAKISNYFEKDDDQCVKISSISGDIYAYFQPAEPDDAIINMPHFALSDLKSFITVMEKFGINANVSYGTKTVTKAKGSQLVEDMIVDRFSIDNGKAFAKVGAENPHEVRPFQEELILVAETDTGSGDVIYSFVMSQEEIKHILDLAKAMGVHELRIGMLDEKFSVVAIDASDDTTDLSGVDFNLDFKSSDSMSVIMNATDLSCLYAGSYRVDVYEEVVVFTNELIKLKYFIGINDRKYSSKW